MAEQSDPVFQLREKLQSKLKWGDIMLTKTEVSATDPVATWDSDAVVADDFEKHELGSRAVFPDGIVYITASNKVRVHADGVFDDDAALEISVAKSDSGDSVVKKLVQLQRTAAFRDRWIHSVTKRSAASDCVPPQGNVLESRYTERRRLRRMRTGHCCRRTVSMFQMVRDYWGECVDRRVSK